MAQDDMGATSINTIVVVVTGLSDPVIGGVVTVSITEDYGCIC